MFNGDKGRIELEVVESAFRVPNIKGAKAEGATHGEKALPNEGHQQIILHKLWGTPTKVPYTIGTGGHGACWPSPSVTTCYGIVSSSLLPRLHSLISGGGDIRMLDQIFGPRPNMQPEDAQAVSHLSANQLDGALAMAVGLAANESFKTGQRVDVAKMLGVEL